MNTKARFEENSLESVLWVVNVMPKAVGISIPEEKIFAPFWVLHLFLLLYVWLVGCAVFQMNYAQGVEDFIKSYVNVSLLILAINISYWFIANRSLIATVLTLVKRIDELSRETASSQEKYRKHMSVMKKMVFLFYLLNWLDACCIYIPHRIDLANNQYSMTPCVGIEPLTVFPKREICVAILIIQQMCMVTVLLTYQAVLLFLIAYIATMYHLLAEDIMLFDRQDLSDIENITEAMAAMIRRHTLILKIIDKIRALYSIPLGINFGSNAGCICFFFYLPLQEWVKFSPILIYCFVVFFLYCFLCQLLINAAEKFERAVYSCGWEKFRVSDQRLVYIMLVQAQKPITVMAAGIIPVNIYTFATTLQAMFKFITVIKF